MEKGKISLFKSPEIKQSLKSIQYEYTAEKDKKGKKILRIWGKYTHIAEALIRAAWCNHVKGLNIWIHIG